MLDFNARERFDRTFARLRWIATAMVGSLFIEAVVVEMIHWFVPFSGFAVEDGFSPNLLYVLLIVGLADLMFLPVLRRNLLADRSGSSPATLMTRMRVVTILSLAISHAPAILGLLIFLLWEVRWVFYVLWVVALFSMLVYFPRQSFWEEWVEGGGRLEV